MGERLTKEQFAALKVEDEVLVHDHRNEYICKITRRTAHSVTVICNDREQTIRSNGRDIYLRELTDQDRARIAKKEQRERVTRFLFLAQDVDRQCGSWFGSGLPDELLQELDGLACKWGTQLTELRRSMR